MLVYQFSLNTNTFGLIGLFHIDFNYAMLKYFYFFLLLTNFVHAQNLIKNPDCELPLVNGKIPFWNEIIGSQWSFHSSNPDPKNGKNYFYAGDEVEAELGQTISLNDYSCSIDQNNQSFQFAGYTRVYSQSPPDQSQVIIEMLSSNNNLLQTFDLGIYSPTDEWKLLSKLVKAPPSTRKIKIRLISHRKNGLNNDGYFDNLSLLPVNTIVNSNVTNISKTICEGETYLGYKLSGIYNDTLRNSKGCDSIRALNLTVTELPRITFNNATEICYGGKIDVVPTFIPNNLPLNFKWSTGESTSKISINQFGTYELIATNKTCNIKAYTIITPCHAKIIAPDIFTPNNDGFNDTFKVYVLDGIIVRAIIYDRWGNSIYSDETQTPQWDGKFQGNTCTNDTFAYILKYKTLLDDLEHEYFGTILLNL